jgi:predicted phage terminase large subunit-like protein
MQLAPFSTGTRGQVRIPSREQINRELERRQIAIDRERVAREGDAIRVRCKSLIEFVREFFPILEPTRSFVDGWAIQAVCQHLEAVSDGRIQYLLINVPPGMMKSLLVAVFWPAWEWANRDASLRYLTSSFSRVNVIRDNSKMRKLVESEKYRALYPQVVLDPTSNAKDKFENLKTGNREGRAFASMTGGRGDRVIIDDPHSVDSAESETQRESVVQTFREAIPDRLNDMQTSVIVVIMQRLHALDVAGTILKERFPYVHLNLPMEFMRTKDVNGVQRDARCRTYVDADLGPDNRPREGAVPFFVDPRTHDGELLFPKRFPAEVIHGLKKIKGPYAWAGQYQQEPTAREGGMFKREWFAGKIIPRALVPATAFQRVRAWDFAGTEEAEGDPDYTVGLRMMRHGVDYYVEGLVRDRLSPGSVQMLVKAMAETDPIGTTIRIPVDPAQAGIYQANSYVSALAGYPLKPEKPTGSKVGRALPVSIQAQYGHIYLVNDGDPAEGVDEWITTLLDEVCTFPKAAHDDQVDALADAFNELALNEYVPFESASAGQRETITTSPERDSRYNFRDNDAVSSGSGFGSARSFTDGSGF